MEVAWKFIFVFLIAVGFGLLLTLPTMWLWNWLMPVIFNLPRITFWQAVGLQMLCRCLIPGVTINKKD